jgi:hypothetical protein
VIAVWTGKRSYFEGRFGNKIVAGCHSVNSIYTLTSGTANIAIQELLPDMD